MARLLTEFTPEQYQRVYARWQRMSGKELPGSNVVTADAPLDVLPRAGAILPKIPDDVAATDFRSKFHGQMGLALCRNSYKAPRIAALGYVLSTLPYSSSFSISARQRPGL